MTSLPNRHQSVQYVYHALQELVEDIGANAAASEVGVSSDTIRRRIRGTQPWYFEEVIDLARHEIARGNGTDIAKAVLHLLSPDESSEARPLLLPSNLREMLRLVGRLTTEIADALDDGRVDRQEAKRLVELLTKLNGLTEGLSKDLTALIKNT